MGGTVRFEVLAILLVGMILGRSEAEELDEMLKPKPFADAAEMNPQVPLPLRPASPVGAGAATPFLMDQASTDSLTAASATRKVQSQVTLFSASLNSNFDVHEHDAIPDDPVDRTRWKADEAVRFPLWGSVYVFGQFGAGCEDTTTQERNFSSRTGIGWKFPAWMGGDIQVRGGRAISYAEALRPEDTSRHSDIFIELQGQWSLLGPVKLEYSGTALPAQSPLEHDRVNQDVRLAFPIRKSSSFRLGAKHSWESQTLTKTWSDGMEIYLGLSLSQ